MSIPSTLLSPRPGSHNARDLAAWFCLPGFIHTPQSLGLCGVHQFSLKVRVSPPIWVRVTAHDVAVSVRTDLALNKCMMCGFHPVCVSISGDWHELSSLMAFVALQQMFLHGKFHHQHWWTLFWWYVLLKYWVSNSYAMTLCATSFVVPDNECHLVAHLLNTLFVQTLSLMMKICDFISMFGPEGAKLKQNNIHVTPWTIPVSFLM